MKFEDYKKKLQQDPEYVAAEKELKPILDLADEVLRLRIEKGWSQAELAERAGTKQSNISRLESGLANPSMKFLQKVANTFGTELEVCLQAKRFEITRIIHVPIVVETEISPWEKKRRERTSWKDRAQRKNIKLPGDEIWKELLDTQFNY